MAEPGRPEGPEGHRVSPGSEEATPKEGDLSRGERAPTRAQQPFAEGSGPGTEDEKLEVDPGAARAFDPKEAAKAYLESLPPQSIEAINQAELGGDLEKFLTLTTLIKQHGFSNDEEAQKVGAEIVRLQGVITEKADDKENNPNLESALRTPSVTTGVEEGGNQPTLWDFITTPPDQGGESAPQDPDAAQPDVATGDVSIDEEMASIPPDLQVEIDVADKENPGYKKAVEELIRLRKKYAENPKIKPTTEDRVDEAAYKSKIGERPDVEAKLTEYIDVMKIDPEEPPEIEVPDKSDTSAEAEARRELAERVANDKLTAEALQASIADPTDADKAALAAERMRVSREHHDVEHADHYDGENRWRKYLIALAAAFYVVVGLQFAAAAAAAGVSGGKH